MDRRETERLLSAIRDVRAGGGRAALATVVRVKGSAYRREGAHMLVRETGAYECALSGGCLEPAVADAAARVIAGGRPVVLNYDLQDDSVWGLGIGCTGAVDIRIERLEDDSLTQEWLGILERGEAAVLVTPLDDASGRLLVRGAGPTAGGLSDAALDGRAAARARERLRTGLPQSGAEVIDGRELFFEVALPPPALVVFGAGFDAEPLARQAWAVGFAVTVVDVRDAFLDPARFPGATLVSSHFAQFAERVPLRAGSFVVVMNHHLERDRESLRFALSSGAAYIGVLGPRARYERLLGDLAAEGVEPSADELAAVRSPIGLALGAETADEVALSIVAEIVAVRNGFEGGALSGTAGSLHRAADRRLLASS
ncbi:MAG TPA: XdhC family protein [Vicinamibacterales bacterium]|nr:XdhC family protein [Vicinamibacterales bacterium]